MSEHHFISYSRLEEEFAIKFADALTAGPPSFKVWLDQRDIPPSFDWDDSIVEALRTCESLLFLMSPDSVSSTSGCKLEWRKALSYKKIIVPILVNPDAEMPFGLGERQHINFTDGFDRGIARLRTHLNWLKSNEGLLQIARYRLADAERDWRRERDETQKARIEEDIVQIKKDIQRLEQVINNPQELVKRTEANIKGGIERERQPIRPVSRNIQGKFINPPPIVAPTYFQDRIIETELIAKFIEDESKRIITVIGRGGIGKTAMVCRLLKYLENGRLPDSDKKLSVDGIVYLSGNGGHRVSVPNIFASLSKLLSDDVAGKIEEIYKNPQTSLEVKVQSLLDNFQTGRIILLLDNFEDLIDYESHCIKDAELKDVLQLVLTSPHHTVKVVITSRISPADLISMRAGSQSFLELDEGLPSPYAETVLRELDEDEKLGLKSAPDELLNEAREITRGFPRALEALISILRSDRDSTLREILDEAKVLPPETVTAALVGEAFNRLTLSEQQVIQALAIYGRPVTITAVDFLLQPYQIGIDSSSILKQLVNLRFTRREANHYYLHPIDRAYALSRIEIGKKTARRLSQNKPSQFTQYELRRKAADYFSQIRIPHQEWKNIADLAPQLAEFDLRMEGEDYEAAASILMEISVNYLNRWGHSKLTLELFKKILNFIKDTTFEADYYFNLGITYQNFGQFSNARDNYEKSLNLYQIKGDSFGENACFGNLSMIHHRLGNTLLAIEYIEKVLHIKTQIGDESEKYIALEHLGTYYTDLGQIRRGIEFYEQSLKIAREIKNFVGEEAAIHNLASCYQDLGQIEKAMELSEQALTINREKTFYRDWEANHLLGLGNCYHALSQVSKAKEYFEEALKITQKTGNRAVEAESFADLGHYELSIGNTQKAKELYEESLKIYREIENRSEQGLSIGSLGDCYFNLGEIKTAIDFYNQALEIARETKRRTLESLQLRNLANAANYEKRYQDAIKFAVRSRTIGEKLESPYDGSYGNTYLAEAYLFSGKLDEARSAIDLAAQFNIPLNNHKVQLILGSIALGQNDVLTAKQAFLSAINKAEGILLHNEKSYHALDVKGLAMCGAAVCEQSDNFAAAEEIFKSARSINRDTGILLQNSSLLETLAGFSKTSTLKEIKNIVEG